MNVYVIIGKNFGDEGKGLATDYFAARAKDAGQSCLVIRHNGGGQAGHTVELPDSRFVFHQLSSGSLRGADTYWGKHFLPDLYKLPEELEEFAALHGALPRLFGHPDCRCVCIDDVLVNMALENARGKDRHGSCGMGINEAVERSGTPGCCLTLAEVCSLSPEGLYRRLAQLRREYLPGRLARLGLTPDRLGEYGELLKNDNVLINAAAQMHLAARQIVLSEGSFSAGYDTVVFEGAQGLLLDENYLPFAPHLTSSRTGAENPLAFIRQHFPDVSPELVYVTRSYVTRHGAGPLPNKAAWGFSDATNLRNPWQGALRFAPHGSCRDFTEPVRQDLQGQDGCLVSCMLTHLNETGGTIRSTEGDIPWPQWTALPEFRSTFDRVYCSDTPFSKDIRVMAY